MLAVVLLVAGQLVAFAHEAAVRHAVCSEHGELLDVATPSEHASSTDRDHAEWLAVEGHGGGHADCTIARLLEQPSATESAAVSIAVATQTTQLADRPLTAVELALDLYLIAPKTSPPV